MILYRTTHLYGRIKRIKRKQADKIAESIDIQCEIEPVAFDDMANRAPAESSASIRERVIKARTVQNLRFKAEKGIYSNAQMNSRLLHQYAWPDEHGLAKLKDRMTKLNMSSRAFDRILRVARTIADLEYAATMPAEEAVTAPVLSRHIAEAIGYRALDRASYGQIF